MFDSITAFPVTSRTSPAEYFLFTPHLGQRSCRMGPIQRSITAKRRVFVMGHMGEAKWFRLVALSDSEAMQGKASDWRQQWC